MAVALPGLAWQGSFTLARDTAGGPLLGMAVLAGVAIVGRRTGRPRLAAAGTAFLQLTLFTALGVMLSYTVAAQGGAFWDLRLARWDAALGFDWASIRTAVDGSAALVWLLGIAYHGLVPQMIVIVVALSYVARFDTLRVTVAAAILSGLATILLSALMPAAGNLFDPARFQHLWTPVALAQAPLIAGLRDGSMRVLDLGALQGIITFPSYHAALAAIFIYAFRRVPTLSVPGRLWAGLTILATPLGGGHYATDVIAGLALALVAVPAATILVRVRIPLARRRKGAPNPTRRRALVRGRPEPVGSAETAERASAFGPDDRHLGRRRDGGSRRWCRFPGRGAERRREQRRDGGAGDHGVGHSGSRM